ncbi:MAG: hypothetical protein ACQBVK_04170, partial [Candidatus Phytoplasma sp. TWB_XP]
HSFWTIFQALEQSVSSDEKITLLRVLISTFSLISEERSNPDEQITLMLEAITRTLSHLEVVQRAVGTMRQRMEMLLQAGWGGRAQVDLLKLKIHGAKLSGQKVERSFLTLFGNWIQRALCSNTKKSSDTPTSFTPKTENPMWVPMGSGLSWEWYLSWMNGEESLLETIQ